MHFGTRYIQQDEPIMYFENIKISLLSEQNNPVMARGGWGNLPHVVWEDRSEMTFALSEGILSSVGMGILFGADVVQKTVEDKRLVRRKEGPFALSQADDYCIELKDWPVDANIKKTFIYEYDRGVIQNKIYGKRIHGHMDPFDDTKQVPCIRLYKNKELTELADADKQYVIEYYYYYPSTALIYNVTKERFNGLFSLEGKFYSKDQNQGINYTNLIYMPKVRVISDINLRLGEKADPTMSVFKIIGMPEAATYGKPGLILEITRLDQDIDGV